MKDRRRYGLSLGGRAVTKTCRHSAFMGTSVSLGKGLVIWLPKKYLRITTQNNFFCYCNHMFVALTRLKKIITSSLLQVRPVATEILSCQTEFPLQPLPQKPPSEMVHLITACASCEAAPGPHFAHVNYSALKTGHTQVSDSHFRRKFDLDLVVHTFLLF